MIAKSLNIDIKPCSIKSKSQNDSRHDSYKDYEEFSFVRAVKANVDIKQHSAYSKFPSKNYSSYDLTRRMTEQKKNEMLSKLNRFYRRYNKSRPVEIKQDVGILDEIVIRHGYLAPEDFPMTRQMKRLAKDLIITSLLIDYHDFTIKVNNHIKELKDLVKKPKKNNIQGNTFLAISNDEETRRTIMQTIESYNDFEISTELSQDDLFQGELENKIFIETLNSIELSDNLNETTLRDFLETTYFQFIENKYLISYNGQEGSKITERNKTYRKLVYPYKKIKLRLDELYSSEGGSDDSQTSLEDIVNDKAQKERLETKRKRTEKDVQKLFSEGSQYKKFMEKRIPKKSKHHQIHGLINNNGLKLI